VVIKGGLLNHRERFESHRLSDPDVWFGWACQNLDFRMAILLLVDVKKSR